MGAPVNMAPIQHTTATRQGSGADLCPAARARLHRGLALRQHAALAHVGDLEAVLLEEQVGGLEVAVRDGPRRQLVQVGQPRAELFARRAPRLDGPEGGFET